VRPLKWTSWCGGGASCDLWPSGKEFSDAILEDMVVVKERAGMVVESLDGFVDLVMVRTRDVKREVNM
jgi:hypothetical protein